MDLEQVINFVLEIKTIYPGWKLQKLDHTGGRDSLPPLNWYEYSFITPEGHCFNYGGIKNVQMLDTRRFLMFPYSVTF